MDPVLVFCEITCQRLGFEMVLGPEKPEHEIVFPNDSRICHALFDPIFHLWEIGIYFTVDMINVVISGHYCIFPHFLTARPHRMAYSMCIIMIITITPPTSPSSKCIHIVITFSTSIYSYLFDDSVGVVKERQGDDGPGGDGEAQQVPGGDGSGDANCHRIVNLVNGLSHGRGWV